MDGNGRWAKDKGKHRVFGHQNGVIAVRDTVEGAVVCMVCHGQTLLGWTRQV